MKKAFSVCLFLCIVAVGQHAFADQKDFSILPSSVVQGEPFMVVVNSTSQVKEIKFGTLSLGVFSYQGKSASLAGVDLYKKAGDYKITVTFIDGTKIEKNITVLNRKKEEEVLLVPEKLGGNTPQNQKKVVDVLAQENYSLNNIKTNPTKSFWKEPFRFPTVTPFVTDPYGFTRITGSYSIAHKGTDFRAVKGTPVYAMNRGVVRLAHVFTVYGKTVIIDHGLGLSTLYMHLSKIYVNEGQLAEKGQMVGLSGDTGYAEHPHLHLSVKINSVSIDPMKFLELFK